MAPRRDSGGGRSERASERYPASRAAANPTASERGNVAHWISILLFLSLAQSKRSGVASDREAASVEALLRAAQLHIDPYRDL